MKQRFPFENCELLVADVLKSGLPDAVADKVYGEAILTMHADHRKSEMIAEAHRILKTGGLYGIHELSLVEDDLSEKSYVLMKQELARVSHVNARPLTTPEWQILLEKQGFKVLSVSNSRMLLLEPRRMLAEEGVVNFIKIIFKLLTHPEERKRVLALRKTFTKYAKNLNAVAIVAQKH